MYVHIYTYICLYYVYRCMRRTASDIEQPYEKTRIGRWRRASAHARRARPATPDPSNPPPRPLDRCSTQLRRGSPSLATTLTLHGSIPNQATNSAFSVRSCFCCCCCCCSVVCSQQQPTGPPPLSARLLSHTPGATPPRAVPPPPTPIYSSALSLLLHFFLVCFYYLFLIFIFIFMSTFIDMFMFIFIFTSLHLFACFAAVFHGVSWLFPRPVRLDSSALAGRRSDRFLSLSLCKNARRRGW